MGALRPAYSDTDAVVRLGGVFKSLGPDVRRHSIRTLGRASEIWRASGMESEPEVTMAFLLHDIGKCVVPAQVLRAARPLTEDEWTFVRRHPSQGARLLERAGLIHGAAIVAAHHERFDGSGYPSGLEGREIPYAARVLAVADAFDAMTDDRPYQPAMSADAAIDLILAATGTQFCPAAVDAMLAVQRLVRAA